MTEINRYEVSPAHSLKGTVTVSGDKNTTLKALYLFPHISVGSLTLNDPASFSQVKFVECFLQKSGAKFKREKSTKDNKEVLKISGEKLIFPEIDLQTIRKLCHLTRMAVPILTHQGKVIFSKPGYSPYGPRPIEPVLKILKHFKIDISEAGGMVEMKWDDSKRRSGSTVVIPHPVRCLSTAEAALSAAVARKGITKISNMACDPCILDIANLYERLSTVKIEGKNTFDWVITSDGLDIAQPYHVELDVPGDHLEASTLAVATAVVGGDITIKNVYPERMEAIINALKSCGVTVEVEDKAIRVVSDGKLKAMNIETGHYPKFPTDAQGPFMTLLALSDGVSYLKENIWTNRLMQAAELGCMGANIELLNSQEARIQGVKKLVGKHVIGTCPRSTAGLIIAGLKAEGTTFVEGADLIDSAYTSLISNLQALGANINFTANPA